MEIDRFEVHKTFPIVMEPVTFTFYMVFIKRLMQNTFWKCLIIKGDENGFKKRKTWCMKITSNKNLSYIYFFQFRKTIFSFQHLLWYKRTCFNSPLELVSVYFIQDCLFLTCRPSDSIVLANRGNEPKTVPEVELTIMHARHSAQLAKFCTV